MFEFLQILTTQNTRAVNGEYVIPFSVLFMGSPSSMDCFSHGQLYVACSRVGKPDNLNK